MGTDEKGERRQGKRTGNDSGDRLVSVSGTVPKSTCQTPCFFVIRFCFRFRFRFRLRLRLRQCCLTNWIPSCRMRYVCSALWFSYLVPQLCLRNCRMILLWGQHPSSIVERSKVLGAKHYRLRLFIFKFEELAPIFRVLRVLSVFKSSSWQQIL